MMLVALTALILRTPPPLAPGVAAFPRLARPATAAAARVNAAATRLDARARRAVRACRVDGGSRADWRRTVVATVTGHAFLSYVVTDEVDCGGAYPSESHAAIVYDLATGAPVDWSALLGPRLAGTQALAEGPDGVRTVTLDSPRLRALYAQRYDAAARAAGAPAECLGDGEAEGFIQPMIAWLGAAGLRVQFDLNHAMQACSVAVTIPVAVLQREGASARLTEALRGAG